jgi:hypothetical protein
MAKGGKDDKRSGGGGNNSAAKNFADQAIAQVASKQKEAGGGGGGGKSQSPGRGDNTDNGKGRSSGGSGGNQKQTGLIQQSFGGGQLTKSEYKAAADQHGGKTVRSYIQDSTRPSQLGEKLTNHLSDKPSMAGYFGKAEAPVAAERPAAAPAATAPAAQSWDSDAFNSALEAQLAPMRQQLSALQATQKPATPTGGGGVTEGGSGLKKPEYNYRPTDPSEAFGSGDSDLMPSLYKVWQSAAGSFNPASTAYMTSSGGDRRQGAADSNSTETANRSGGDWRHFWNKGDRENIQDAWASPSSDNSTVNDNITGDTTPQGVRRRPGRYSDSGQRMAGSAMENSGGF